MPTTVKGIPYPADTDPPDVPSDLQRLAENLDFSKIPLLTVAQIPNATTLLSAYPLGISLMTLTSTEATAGGWPGGAFCNILTVKPVSGRASQYLFKTSGSPQSLAAYYRQLQPDPGPHSVWAGGSGPYAYYLSTVTLDGSTNPTAAKVLTWPANRFTVAPRVQVGTNYNNWLAAPSSITATSVSLTARYTTTTTTTPIVTVSATQATSALSETDPPVTTLVADPQAVSLMTVTCAVPGCPNEGIGLEVPSAIDDGEQEIPIESWVCGGCGTETPTA